MRRLWVVTLLAIVVSALAVASIHAASATTVITSERSPGTLDTTFDPGTGANDIVFAVALQPDGTILVGGQFSQFNNIPHTCLVRLTENGSLDSAYKPNITGPGFAAVVGVALQPDGKALIGGLFTRVNGVARSNIARLKTDGSLDTSFNPGTGVTGEDAYLNVIKTQADGRILIGGVFSGYNGVARHNIARLTALGALDATFNPGSGTDGEVAAIAVQPSDGKVLLGGSFTTVNGITRRGVARLNTNGSVDTAFNPVLDGDVLALLVQPDGKIVIGGDFTRVNGVSRNRIARLNTDGSLDTTFDPGTGANKPINALAQQDDGKIILGGKFTSIDGVERNRVARLKPDGSLDPSFDPGAGASWSVFAVVLQPDGRILIGGAFETVANVARRGVARLWGDYRAFLPLVRRR